MTDSPVPFSGIPITQSSSKALNGINFNPVPNVLNNFDQVAYHIKFAVLSDIPGIDKEIVIAESGTTELDIVSLDIGAIVGPDIQTKNMSAHSMKMEINEFYGYSLMNRLIEAANILQVRNYQKTGFKIEVKFLGRDAETGKPLANVLGSEVWGWKVVISSISTKVTASGCVHILEMHPISDVAGTDEYLRLPESFGIDGRTCGDLLNNLFGKLNADLKEKYGGIDMVTYHIEAAPYPPSAQSPVRTPLDLEITNDTVFSSVRRLEQGSVNTGIAINELIDVLISNSETGVTLANSVGVNGTGTPSNPHKNHSVLVRIEKKVEYGNYIDLFNDYEKKITYCLVPYSTIRPIANFNDYANVQDVERTTKRLAFACSELGMKKQYNYIFTGENTEVLNFNIDFTFSYCVSVDLMLGARTYYSTTPGQAFNQDAVDRATASEYQANIEKLRDLTGRKNAALQSSNPGSFTADDQKELDTVQQIVDNDREKVQIAARQSEQRANARLRQSKIDLASRGKTSYIDDDDYKKAITDLPTNPITMRQVTNVSGSMEGVVEGSSDPRRSVYAAILDQVYGTDSNLSSVKIDIRGDPYWLGPPGYRDLYDNGFSVSPTKNDPNVTIHNSSPSAEKYANFSNGENVIVIRYRMPDGFDEVTGKPNIIEANSYSGFYSINTVTHKFSGGKFTQTLEGIRIPACDLTKVLRQGT